MLADIHIPHPYGGRAIPISERQILTLRERCKHLETKLRDVCSRNLCDRQTCTEDAAAVRALRSSTGETQLDAAINSALQDLAQCDQP